MEKPTKKAAAKSSSPTKNAAKKTSPKPAATKSAAKKSPASDWTVEKVLAEMKKMGTAQNVKIYKRHGMPEPVFGVSFANLGQLQKQIKTNHELAKALWATKNADARNLAVKIADPAQFTEKELDAMVKDQNWYGSCDMLSGLIGKTKFAQKKAEEWIDSKSEWISRTGWNLIGGLAFEPKSDFSDAYFEKHLKRIEKEIHSEKNYTRHAMNMTVICIGARNEKLRKLAEAAAKRIGKVDVDHGETDCKTPDVIPYIAKIWARKK